LPYFGGFIDAGSRHETRKALADRRISGGDDSGPPPQLRADRPILIL